MELQLGVEIVVWHDVDLAELRVHVALMSHQPDDRRLAALLFLGLKTDLTKMLNL